MAMLIGFAVFLIGFIKLGSLVNYSFKAFVLCVIMFIGAYLMGLATK